MEKLTLETVTQEHIDLLNAFFLGVNPAFKLSKSEKAKAASDAAEKICWFMFGSKPRDQWADAEIDKANEMYVNWRESLFGARAVLSMVQAVTNTTSKKNGQAAIDVHVKVKVAKDREAAFAQRDLKPAKRGAPPKCKYAKSVAKMREGGMPWENIRMILEHQVSTGLSADLTIERINDLVQGGQAMEAK